MRTYGLVCMASAAITVVAGYPNFWYGGQVASHLDSDPTRVIQGVVAGIGFLGAGGIMREGLNISGLTTAASILASSAIGIMVGVGFYAAAILLALLSAACMLWVSKLEGWLPSRPAIGRISSTPRAALCSRTSVSCVRNWRPSAWLCRNSSASLAPARASSAS